MGPAGAGSLAQLINTAIAGKTRFDEMKDFFGDTGSGDDAGIWHDKPVHRPEFRESWRRKIEKQAKARKAEEMI
jgi:chlorophyllide a reductase subunit Y